MATSAGARGAARGANRLIREKSPYLLQHAHNPVDWYPWGDEAFKKAREEGKPIFLSIGYATCHWCHAMEQESFSDTEVAALLNEKFVSIKVDREERPDIDAVYIAAATLLNGEAGWPLTLVLTPDRQPFFAGGYFPKPRLLAVLSRIAEAWAGQHASVVASAELLTKSLQQRDAGEGDALGANDIEHATRELAARFDATNGGFLPAPKFPAAHELLFLLRSWKRTGDAKTLAMVTTTLRAMHRGAIFDQIGYGFHRYVTDAEWRAPHFEKTLYDQAMLAMAYTEAYQASGDSEFRDAARQILEYALRDLRSPEGAFIAGEDADSGGQEGAFYRWTSEELHQVTGDDFASDAFGSGALRMAMPAEELARKYEIPLESAGKRVEAARRALFVARSRRVRSSRDDAVLTDWNGLMIAALAEAAAVFDDPSYAAAARRAADFVLTKIRRKDGRLLHRFRGGEAAIPAMLDDYAFLVWGLLNLYEAHGDVRDLESAIALEKESQHLFGDTDGTFFLTASDAESLLIRPRELHDIAIPSGNAAQLTNLVRLGLMTGKTEYTTAAEKLAHAAAPEVRASPSAATHLLSGISFLLGPSFEIVLAGDRPDAFRSAVFTGFVPNKVVLYRPAAVSTRIATLAPFTKAQTSKGGKATAYVCRNYQCRLPTTDPEAVRKMMISEP